MEKEELKQSREHMSEPLLWLSEPCIAIFPHQILQYTKAKGSLTSLSTATLPTLNDLDQPEKVVSFLNGDIAFRIDENLRKVTILKVQK